MISAFVAAGLRGDERHPDPALRGRVRELQRLRSLGQRAREKLGAGGDLMRG